MSHCGFHRGFSSGMMKRFAMPVAVVGMVLALGACGGKGGSSPAGPSGGNAAIGGTVTQDSSVAGLTPASERYYQLARTFVGGLLSPSEAIADKKGCVQMNGSQPASGITVTLLGYPGGAPAGTATTGPNGKFEFSGVAAGQYQLKFEKTTSSGSWMFLSNPVTATEEDGKLEVEGKITVAGASGGLILHMEAFSQKGTYSDCHEKSGEKKSGSGKIEIKGTVTSLSPLTVSSGGTTYTVTTDSSTKFEGTPTVGATVEVEGTLTGPTAILAKEVEVKKSETAKKDDDDDDDDDDHKKKS